MLQMHRNETGKKGAMVFFFLGEKIQTAGGQFFSWGQLQQVIMFCDAFMSPYNSPICPWNKTFHLHVLKFTNMSSKHCFIYQQHFITKGEMKTNICTIRLSNNVKFTDLLKSRLQFQFKPGSSK